MSRPRNPQQKDSTFINSKFPASAVNSDSALFLLPLLTANKFTSNRRTRSQCFALQVLRPGSEETARQRTDRRGVEVPSSTSFPARLLFMESRAPQQHNHTATPHQHTAHNETTTRAQRDHNTTTAWHQSTAAAWQWQRRQPIITMGQRCVAQHRRFARENVVREVVVAVCNPRQCTKRQCTQFVHKDIVQFMYTYIQCTYYVHLQVHRTYRV